MRVLFVSISILGLAVLVAGTALTTALAQDTGRGQTVYQATLMEPNQKTGEVSTEELRQALANGSATVYDSRAPLQYALGHIPGALNGPDLSVTPMTAGHVAGIEQLLPNKDSAIILYCDGPI
jgi:3-mercaptopyruvate sulfurtransferase SseA